MKKHLLTLALLASAVAASAQTLYSTEFATEDEFNQWTVIDVNEDAYTWKFDASASDGNVFYPYCYSNAGDDWLISPELTPEKDGNAVVSYSYKGSYYGEAMDVYTGTANTVEGMTTLQKQYTSLNGDVASDYFIVQVKAGEPFRIGFHATSPADKWRLYLKSVSVMLADKLVDLKVSDILSPTSGKDLGQETVTVRVKNDGTDAAEGFDVAFKVNDGEATVEHVSQTLAAGESLDYTFSAKADLSEGPKNHTLKAYTIFDSDFLPTNDTTAVKVRCSKAVTPPYTMGFETSEDTDDLVFYNLNEDDGDWTINTSMWTNTARTGYSSLVYNYNKDNAADDWAMLAPISVEAGYYVLRYWYSAMDDRNEEKMAVYWGNGNTPADMTHLINDHSSILGASYREGIGILEFTEPQTIYIGFKAYSDANKNWLCVDDVQFYKTNGDDVDFVVNSIDKPFDFVRTPNNKDVAFEVRSVGLKEATATVKVTVDDAVKYTEQVTLAAQENKTITAADAIAGLLPGKHTLKVSIESDNDTDLSNNAIEKEINVLGEPTLFYDFEDAKLPADLTFFTWDEGTINEGAGEEFNEYGWGIINIENHAMLGEHLLGGTSWLNDNVAANRWVILPQMHNNSSETYLVWDANSGNNLFLEDYNIKVSDGSGVPSDWWYSSFETIKGESTTPKTRGTNVAKSTYYDYTDKDVYVAFNLVTASGDFLCLDNIGIYGDITLTGIQNVNADFSSFFDITANSISTPNAETITVTDMSGRTVQTTNGPQANIAGLKSGIYMATIKTANGSKSVKFVKK